MSVADQLAKNPAVPLLLVGGLVAAVLYAKRKEIAKAFNPVSDQNLAYKGASAVAGALTGREGSLGSIAYDIVHGTDTQSASVFYIVEFPGGIKHAVDSSQVSNSGQFKRDGVTYELRSSSSGKFAVPVSSLANVFY